MARGTYISKNLTQNQISFLLMLNDYKMDIFTLNKLKQLASNRLDDVNELVKNLAHKKILSRIERGKYCLGNKKPLHANHVHRFARQRTNCPKLYLHNTFL